MDLERMKKKLEELRKKKEGRRKDFWGPKEGPNDIRVLPNWTGDLAADFYYQTAYHKNLGPSKDKSCVCPKAEGRETCPVCKAQSELYETKDKENIAFAKEIRPQVRVYWNIIDLKEKEKGVQVMFTGVDVLDQVLAYSVNPKYGDLSDPINGRNITLVFTEGSKSKTGFNEYDVQPDPEKTPIEDPAWLEQMIDLKALVKVLETEEIEAIMYGETEKKEKSGAEPEKPKPEPEKPKPEPEKPKPEPEKSKTSESGSTKINAMLEKIRNEAAQKKAAK